MVSLPDKPSPFRLSREGRDRHRAARAGIEKRRRRIREAALTHRAHAEQVRRRARRHGNGTPSSSQEGDADTNKPPSPSDDTAR